MLICYKCGAETERPSVTRPGQGYCPKCVKNLKRKIARRGREEAMKSLGLVKVKGNLGGTYWE